MNQDVVYDPLDQRAMKPSEAYATWDGLYFASLETQQMYHQLIEKGFEVVLHDGKPSLRPAQATRIWANNLVLKGVKKDSHYNLDKLKPGLYTFVASISEARSRISGIQKCHVQLEAFNNQGKTLVLSESQKIRMGNAPLEIKFAMETEGDVRIRFYNHSLFNTVRVSSSLDFRKFPRMRQDLSDAKKKSSSIAEYGEFSVELTKDCYGLGLHLYWHPELNAVFIYDMDCNSTAQRSCKIEHGDRLKAVQGQRVENMTLRQVIKALRNAPTTAVLLLEHGEEGLQLNPDLPGSRVCHVDMPLEQSLTTSRSSVCSPTSPQLDDNLSLFDCIKLGSFESVQRLLVRDLALLNTRDNLKSLTPLMWAIHSESGGHPDIALYLIESGADINARDKMGMTILMYACQYRQRLVAQALLKLEVDLNAQDIEGRTALMYACLQDQVDVVREILNIGADPNLQDSEGFTALMYPCCKEIASYEGGREDVVDPLSMDCVQTCWIAGTDLHIQTKERHRAIDLASCFHRRDIESFFNFIMDPDGLAKTLENDLQLNRKCIVAFYNAEYRTKKDCTQYLVDADLVKMGLDNLQQRNALLAYFNAANDIPMLPVPSPRSAASSLEHQFLSSFEAEEVPPPPPHSILQQTNESSSHALPQANITSPHDKDVVTSDTAYPLIKSLQSGSASTLPLQNLQSKSNGSEHLSSVRQRSTSDATIKESPSSLTDRMSRTSFDAAKASGDETSANSSSTASGLSTSRVEAGIHRLSGSYQTCGVPTHCDERKTEVTEKLQPRHYATAPGSCQIFSEPISSQMQRYDAFLSHDWGARGQDHATVLEISEKLRGAGKRVWIDEDFLEGNIGAEATEGLQASTRILLFITRRYMNKLARTIDDVCKNEFLQAREFHKPEDLIAIVIDPAVTDSSRWTGLLAESKQNVIDFSTPEKRNANFSQLLTLL